MAIALSSFFRNCDLAVHEFGKGTGARHRKRGPAGDAWPFELLRQFLDEKFPLVERRHVRISNSNHFTRPTSCVAKLSVRELEESCRSEPVQKDEQRLAVSTLFIEKICSCYFSKRL